MRDKVMNLTGRILLAQIFLLAGINKISGEFYHLVYHQVHGIRASSLRLTNTYGPRQLIRHNRQGFIAWFVRLAVEGEEIQLYGDGQQLRDLTYVDDVVDAFLAREARFIQIRKRLHEGKVSERSPHLTLGVPEAVMGPPAPAGL